MQQIEFFMYYHRNLTKSKITSRKPLVTLIVSSVPEIINYFNLIIKVI
jgi:hypothetical protein